MRKNPITLAIGGILLILFLFMLFFFQVRTTESAVVTTFGRYSRTELEPGLKLRLPWPIQNVSKFDKRLQNFERKFETTLTRDQKNLLSTVFVGWRIADPKVFLERFWGDTLKAENALEGIVRNAKNGVLGRHNFSDLISPNPQDVKFEQIEKEMLAAVQPTTKELGISVDLLFIKQLGLPENITADVFKRMKAERDSRARRFAAEGVADATRIRSQADREADELLAKARGDATRIEAQANVAAGPAYAKLEEDPELAIFLMQNRALESSLQNRTLLILDEKTVPFNLLHGVKPSAPALKEAGKSN